MKALKERRNELHEQMGNILNLAKEEARALTDEEKSQFANIEAEIANIDDTIERMEKYANRTPMHPEGEPEDKDVKAFANLVRGIINKDEPTQKDTNGALIPKTIANKIIDKVYDYSPIFQMAEKYNVKGTLSIPYVDEATTTLAMNYATEFVTPDATTLKTGSIDLTGFLAEAFTKVSKSLVSNSDFDIVSVVVDKMAKAIAVFIEKEIVVGGTKITGLKDVKKTVTTAKATALTADELIDLQEEVPDVHQAEAVWIMNKDTRKAIRKLKDGQNNYLLERDFTAKWGYTLLGKPVYTTDSMDKMAAGKTVIYYGDMSGVAVKLSEDINIEILRERFAEQHALGVVGFVELDAKVQDASKIAKLVCANA